MYEKLPISVFIIAKNEEQRIHYALDSVKDWVDEIIVIDSGSTDNTLKIAAASGAAVYFNEWSGYGAQKIFGETKCRNNWILNIDADEEVSEELKQNIFSIFKNGSEPSEAAFLIPWKMIFIGQKTPPKIATGGKIIRLYNKDKASFSSSTVHDSVLLKNKNDKVTELTGIINHRCFESLKHWIAKVNFYTTAQAEDWVNKGRKAPSLARFIYEPILAFLKSYFLRKYVFYGINGFNASIIYAFSKSLRLAKVKELYESRNNK